jgi:hypothetical protein
MEFHVVAFIDVLAFRRMVASDVRSGIPRFLPIFQEVLSAVKDEYGRADNIALQMFSDSIVLNAPLSLENVVEVLRACAALQTRFLQRSILIRGGVSYGKHFSNGVVLFSEGLITAYEIESERARFPRVVVDRNLADYFFPHANLPGDLRDAAGAMLCRDRDGEIFIDFLRGDSGVVLAPQVAELVAAKLEHESVLEKMRWLYDYHRYSLEAHGRADLVPDGQASFERLF